MEIGKDTLILFILCLLYAAGDIYRANKTHKKIDEFITHTEAYAMGSVWAANKLQARVDSLKLETQALAKTVIYLDSCQQAKTQKGERAERRGKFVGGLLKGLFPGM